MGGGDAVSSLSIVRLSAGEFPLIQPDGSEIQDDPCDPSTNISYVVASHQHIPTNFIVPWRSCFSLSAPRVSSPFPQIPFACTNTNIFLPRLPGDTWTGCFQVKTDPKLTKERIPLSSPPLIQEPGFTGGRGVLVHLGDNGQLHLLIYQAINTSIGPREY